MAEQLFWEDVQEGQEVPAFGQKVGYMELNRFAGWLVERRYLQRSPMIGVSVPRRERRLPRVLDWGQVEQIVAGERKPRDRAILALLAYGALFTLLGVLLKRPMIPGLLFVFVWEMVANLPGYLPRFTLTAYLRSLRRMQELSPRVIYPGHGPVVLDGPSKLEEYLEHRSTREAQVVAALAAGQRTPEEIVPAIYGEHPVDLHRLAARSVLAHLLKLENEGRAERRTVNGVVRWTMLEPRNCVRCGRPVKGRGLLCGPCSLAVLQESG